MASKNTQERGRARREAADRKRREEQRKSLRRRWLWSGAAVAAVAGVAGAGWLVATSGGPEPDAAVEEFTHVHGVAVPEWSSDQPFLATHEGLISMAADEEWRLVSEESHDFMGFSAHPTEEGRLYSSGHPAPGSGLTNPLGFMVSEDGGQTWEVRSLEGEVDFHAMTVGGGGEVVYGWDRALYRSTDEGHTWEQVDAPLLAQAEGAAALAGHPEDPDEVWAGTQTGLLRSGDGGQSWDPALQGAPVTAVRLDPGDPDRVLAYSLADGLMESTDGGEEWTELGWTLEDDAVGHLTIHPDNPDLVYAGTHGEGVYRSEDGGESWEALAEHGSAEHG